VLRAQSWHGAHAACSLAASSCPCRAQKRVSEFTRWLGSRTERLVVLIGHSAFWHAFSGKQKRLANCEFYHQPW
jgi:hypothetical protein